MRARAGTGPAPARPIAADPPTSYKSHDPRSDTDSRAVDRPLRLVPGTGAHAKPDPAHGRGVTLVEDEPTRPRHARERDDRDYAWRLVDAPRDGDRPPAAGDLVSSVVVGTEVCP
ncbi:hypothetical protein V5P93_005445 [Actinokineospora auranticolor]|uniref:Uncharacterized protein n=1 Tax=Actinokineospora auranticolor TaxID=155976 RepID=A0A2S6GQR9_9PSEU|nr:hypothetical protein [Actinokineospora auranticolor]PPK67527.1 hypothetical protein CLV40_107192 [Actinokineospora auranticolor]